MARKLGPAIYDRMASDLPINARVAPAVVDDPYGQNGEKSRVVRSLRDDVLGHLHARKEIDDAQFEAGRRYERYAEQSQIGSVKAMDPTKEPVDGGGGIIEPVSDKQIAAGRELAEAERVLGRKPAAIVRAILVGRKKFREIAGSSKEGDVAHVRLTFKEGLEELAAFWNFAGR